MDDSTLAVLRVFYKLQFTGLQYTGWSDAARRLRFDPVPVAALYGELAGTNIDIVREIRILEIAGCVQRDATDWADDGSCIRSFIRTDGKHFALDPDDTTVRVAWDGAHFQPVPIPDADFIRRRYTITKTGLDELRGPRSLPPWRPTPGFVCVKEVTESSTWQKNGKNPDLSTIDRWIKRSAPSRIERDPASNQRWFPPDWLSEQWKQWHPRSRRQHSD